MSERVAWSVRGHTPRRQGRRRAVRRRHGRDHRYRGSAASLHRDPGYLGS